MGDISVDNMRLEVVEMYFIFVYKKVIDEVSLLNKSKIPNNYIKTTADPKSQKLPRVFRVAESPIDPVSRVTGFPRDIYTDTVEFTKMGRFSCLLHKYSWFPEKPSFS